MPVLTTNAGPGLANSTEHRYHPRHMPLQAPALAVSTAPVLASTAAALRPL